MSLTKAQQELVALGASIGAGCHPCTEYHIAEAARAGLSTAEIDRALADAECVKRSAYNELAVRARELLGQRVEAPPPCCDDTSLAKEFVSVGAAIGANSLPQLRKHIEQARAVGMTPEQLREAVEVAQGVQRAAAGFTTKETSTLLAQVGEQGLSVPVFLTESPGGEADGGCGPGCGCNAPESEPAAAAPAKSGGCC